MIYARRTLQIAHIQGKSLKRTHSGERLLEDDDSALSSGGHTAIFFNIYPGYDVVEQEQTFGILLPYSVPCPCVL